MCGQAVVGGQGIMPCPDAARLEQDVWELMQQQAAADAARADLAAEVERYRSALEDIERNVRSLAGGPVPNISDDARWYFQHVRDTCRRALGESPK